MTFKIRRTAQAQDVDARADQCRIPMRDGVHLATDVFLPTGPGLYPAILVRTPYDKTSRYTRYAVLARHYTERGYAFVAQDSRGKYRSEGETVPYLHDVADSYDGVDWIVGQPWSNGTVGLLGSSYPGFIVWAGIASGHPAIKAAIAQATSVDLPTIHLGSRWRRDVPTLFAADDLLQIWTEQQTHYLDIDYDKPPVEAFEEAVAGLGKRSIGLDLLLENARTGEDVDPYDGRHPYDSTNIPVLHWIEWYDPALAGPGLADFHHFRRSSRKDLHYLRAASADHSSFRLEDVPATPQNDPDTNEEAYAGRCAREAAEGLAFFDKHLRGIDAGVADIRWHLGHVGWRSSAEWPPSDAVPLDFHLSGGADGRLTAPAAAPAGRSTESWTHDPADPVPSASTPDEIWEFLRTYPDERALAERDDVLCFTSDALDTPVDLAGRTSLAVAVGSTVPSMHLFAKLQDVCPDGTVRTVVRGQKVLNQPDPEVLTSLELQEIAYRFRPGHRIRLLITSSDHPLYAVHPGTDENPWFATRYERCEQHVVLGGGQPSRLTLQVLPADADPA